MLLKVDESGHHLVSSTPNLRFGLAIFMSCILNSRQDVIVYMLRNRRVYFTNLMYVHKSTQSGSRADSTVSLEVKD